MREFIYATDGHEGHWLTGEEIVRCRDCVHYHGSGIASLTPFCEAMEEASVEPDGFCAWGVKRKEGGE